MGGNWVAPVAPSFMNSPIGIGRPLNVRNSHFLEVTRIGSCHCASARAPGGYNFCTAQPGPEDANAKDAFGDW